MQLENSEREFRSGECVSPEWLSIIPEHDARQRSSAMVRAPTAVAPEAGTSIKIKVVTPRFPTSKEEALQLGEDLERMGCSQLMHRLWGLKRKYMLRELGVRAPN